MNSTFLNYLVDSGQAASKTYGLWVGSESEEAPQDGLLVVGGYDESRLQSAGTIFPTFSDCPTCAILTAITYDVGGKSTTLFSDDAENLVVQLDPYSSDVELPAEMIQNLAAAEKTAVWNTTSRRFEFPATTLPTGTITVTLSDMGAPQGDASKPSVVTYKSVVPAAELYRRPQAYNAAGILEVDNATVYNMAVTNQTGTIRFGTLGLPFFTQNYLIVDPDARSFQLAPAITAPADPKGADAKLKTVCRILPASKQKSHTAALAGAVVGSIVGTLLIVAAILWCLRRRRRNNTSRHSRGESEAPMTVLTHQPSMPTHSSSDTKSLELPLQAPPAAAAAPVGMKLRQGTTVARPSQATEDPRRGLAHEIFRKVDEENDGRLLGERPWD